jgi:hypothetical protein
MANVCCQSMFSEPNITALKVLMLYVNHFISSYITYELQFCHFILIIVY